MHFSYILLVLSICFSAKVHAQETASIRDIIEDLAESLSDDYDLSELEERLMYFQKHPINLNYTSLGELKSLIFLSPIQINAFFEHLKAHGNLIDILELQSIEGFNLETIQKLSPFVTLKQTDLLEPITLYNLSKFGNHDLLFRFGIGLETPKGYVKLSGSHYLGGKERLLIKYKYNFSNRVSASLILEKDAGERFMKSNQQLFFDLQSFHIGIYPRGIFKKIIIGDYTLQFGQGLTLWSGFAFGKSPDITNIVKKDVGLKAYTSTNEYSFQRGIATKVSLLKNVSLTSFLSYRNLDASISLNHNGEEVLANINETGLHRTETEIKNRHSVSQQLYGAILQYETNNLNIGAIIYHTSFNKAFVTDGQVYNSYRFTGRELTNIGFHYNYTFKNIYFFGEYGKSLYSGLAHLNGALISLSSKVSTVLMYRNYQRNYHNFYNQAIAESTDANNELGFYTGLNITPLKSLSLLFYADYFKFKWLKFRIDAPSNGYELLGQLSYTPTKKFRATLRYKTELKQQNTALVVPVNFIEDVKKESYRADVNWQLNKSLNFQNRLEISQFKKGIPKPEFGYMIYQDIAYTAPLSKISGNIRVAYFNTSSYDSRIYAYEDDVLYNFSFGMYNGKGTRTYINLKYKLFKKADVWARYAIFYYPEAVSVGSGLDEIKGKTKSDVKLQLRYQF